MQKKNKKPFSLLSCGASVLAISVLLAISLIAFGSINKSTAWFAKIENVSGKDMSISVEEQLGVSASLVSYAVTDINSSSGIYSIADTESYVLPMRDPNNISYSEFEKALVIIIRISCDKDVSVDISADTANKEVSYEAENFVSNCVKLTPATLNANQTEATLNGEPDTFITIDGNTCEKTDSVVFCSLDLTAGESKTVCLVMEYNEEFLDFFGNYLMMNGSTFTTVDYFNDIKFHVNKK